jgi:hypothetical protein
MQAANQKPKFNAKPIAKNVGLGLLSFVYLGAVGTGLYELWNYRHKIFGREYD